MKNEASTSHVCVVTLLQQFYVMTFFINVDQLMHHYINSQ